MSAYANIDCEAGRKLGCQTFCCRLLVRLDPDELVIDGHNGIQKRFVEKSTDGYCIHLDRDTHLCRCWEQRSRACRGYDCNSDFLLQVALRHKFNNVAELVRLAARAHIPVETYFKIPCRKNTP